MTSFASAVCCLLFVASASAYPWRWLARPGACGKHPSMGYGPHLAPKNDTATTFLVTLVGSKAPVSPKSPLCPGNKYTVKASWSKALTNHALLTTSVGKWAKPPLAKCPTSTHTLLAGNSFTDTVVLPCNAKGSAVFKLTHSQPGQEYLQNSVTYKISAACAAKSCKPKAPPKKAAKKPPPKKTG